MLTGVNATGILQADFRGLIKEVGTFSCFYIEIVVLTASFRGGVPRGSVAKETPGMANCLLFQDFHLIIDSASGTGRYITEVGPLSFLKLLLRQPIKAGRTEHSFHSAI
jgi:hypothetical protein